MAFVYRTVDKQNSPKAHVPGPGAYFKPKKHIQSSELQHRVPFNHSENRQIWKMPQAPGPGTYQPTNITNKQKKLLSDPLNQVIIYQTPSESVPFKSKTIRFTTNANSNNPGPGEYQTDPQIVRPSTGFKKPKVPSSQLKQFLKKKSCISKSNEDLFANMKDMVITAKDQSFHQNFDQTNKDEIQIKKQSKNSIFFASKVQRDIIRNRPQTSAGPGSYNIAKSSFEIQKKYSNKSPVKSICIDKRVDKIYIQELGPGYYELDQAFKNLNQSNYLKKKTIQCFGSTVDRFFTSKTHSYNANPGPAAYSLLKNSAKNNKNSQIPGNSFPKGQRKIFQPPKSAVLPISYNTVEDVCFVKKQKYQRKPKAKGSFGSTMKRFCQKQNQNVEFTNSCISRSLNLIVSKLGQNAADQNKVKQTNFYRTLLNTRQKKKKFEQNISNGQEKQEIKPVIDRPLCYDNESNTFAFKYSYKVQKVAPFMSCAQRFTDKNQQKFIDLNLDDENMSKSRQRQKPSQEKMTKRVNNKREADGKVGWMAVSKDERFKYTKKKQLVGPQYYDPLFPQKRSYNVLFAQIK